MKPFFIRYINGDEYHGDWMDGLRHGYGNLTETSVSGSHYYGDWSNDKCHGYGVYDDKSRYITQVYEKIWNFKLE